MAYLVTRYTSYIKSFLKKWTLCCVESTHFDRWRCKIKRLQKDEKVILERSWKKPGESTLGHMGRGKALDFIFPMSRATGSFVAEDTWSGQYRESDKHSQKWLILNYWLGLTCSFSWFARHGIAKDRSSVIVFL